MDHLDAHVSLGERANSSVVGMDGLRLLLAACGAFLHLYLPQAIQVPLQQSFGLSLAQCAGLLSITTLGLALTAPFSSRWMSRWHLSTSLRGGLLGLALTDVLLACASSLGQLQLVRLLQGLLIPLVLSALLAHVQTHYRGAQAWRLSALYVTGTALGGVLGRFVPALCLPALGWFGSFVVVALGVLLLTVCAWPLGAAAPRGTVVPMARAVPLLALLSKVAPWALAGFGLLFSQLAVFTFVVPLLQAPPYAWSGVALGALYAVFLPACALVQWTPRWVARFGLPRLLTVAGGLAWCGLALTLWGLSGLLVAGLCLFSCGIFLAQTCLARGVSEAAGPAAQQAAGLYLCAYYLGGAVGALAPVPVWPLAGWWGCLALVLGVQTVLLLAWMWARRWRVASNEVRRCEVSSMTRRSDHDVIA